MMYVFHIAANTLWAVSAVLNLRGAIGVKHFELCCRQRSHFRSLTCSLPVKRERIIVGISEA